MVDVTQHPSLTQALKRLRLAIIMPRAAAKLAQNSIDISQAVQRAVLTEVAAFSTSANPAVLPNLARHWAEHIREIQRLYAGGSVSDFEFVAAQAREHAGQHFPLEAVLHACRSGQKILTIWLCDALVADTGGAAVGSTPVAANQDARLATADFAIEYINAISTVLTNGYVAHARVLAEADGDRRTELLNILLSGFDESDARVARLLKRAGYLEQRQSYCVVLAQSNDPLEMENTARVQRIADSVSTALHALGVRTLIGLRNNMVTALLSDTRRISGWTAVQATLATRVEPALSLLGNAVIIGISNDQPSTAYIPKAFREASIALDFAGITERVVQFAGLPLRRRLLHGAADSVHSALPTWIAEFVTTDAKLRGALIHTLRGYADADMNILKAARALGVHPNTIYSRMERIKRLTGLDGQQFHDLTELLLAVDCHSPVQLSG